MADEITQVAPELIKARAGDTVRITRHNNVDLAEPVYGEVVSIAAATGDNYHLANVVLFVPDTVEPGNTVTTPSGVQVLQRKNGVKYCLVWLNKGEYGWQTADYAERIERSELPRDARAIYGKLVLTDRLTGT